MRHSTHPLIVVLGPTGSGKSDLALHLAEVLPGEIVNFDSVQVHRGLNVGSAKVPPHERRGIVHHLIDVMDATDDLSAGAYARMAGEALNEIRSRNVLPVLVGGTGFYLRAVINGLSPAPQRDSGLRNRLAKIADSRPAALHRFLRIHDPTAAQRIHANDRQKLIRAIELTVVARQPASVTQSLPRLPLEGFRVLKLGLNPDRQLLYPRINRRTETMFAAGLIEETKALLDSGVPATAKALQSLGYRQALQYLSGEFTLGQAITDCQTRTRQYAKRQLTWFRAEPDVAWLPGFGADCNIQEQAAAAVRLFVS